MKHTTATTKNSSISLTEGYCALDQTGAVVHGNDLDAFGQLDCSERIFSFTAAMVCNAFFPERITITPPVASPSPSSSPTPRSGPMNSRDIAEPHRDAGGAGCRRYLPKVVERLQVARRPHDVLGFAELEHRSAGFLIGLADRIDHLRVRDAVRGELVGIEHW